jgi:NAD(P)-dependent dehydrogenase (short-subunit alcohol dehydrogenase family)
MSNSIDNDYSGKVALVTGGGSGMGAASALLFAERGAAVAVLDVKLEAAQQIAAQITAQGGSALALAADVGVAEQMEAAVQRAVEHFGRLDAVLNSAGMNTLPFPVADFPLDFWQRTLTVNLSGTFHTMKYAIPALLKSGGGAIVNVASTMGAVGLAGTAAYTASKHGVVGLTKVAALDYAKKNIRVNAIGPGFIDTPMLGAITQDERANRAFLATTPMGRFGQTTEIAELVLFLCSARASFITGAYYPIDGGYLIR